MLAVGITGGIGSGKSTVADLLVERGAVLIDADQVARAVVEPGQPALEALVAAFGPEVLGDDGHLDRQALANRTFGDPEAVATLNAITHPAIGAALVAARAAHSAQDQVVCFAIPLLRPEHRDLLGLDLVIVVDCPEAVALERLVEMRGMDPQDAERRIGAQISRTERRALADLVVDNGGDLPALERAVATLWGELEAARVASRGPLHD